MKTITFYSYKGGVGRSLILANVAKRLTEIGKNVCMLDFDLEAPGLDFKFWDYNFEEKPKGVVDFITSFTNYNILPEEIVKDYTVDIHIGSRKHHGWLKLISAGDIDNKDYWKKLLSIDWKKLFATPDGSGYELILHLKALIEQQVKPDYLLVDSRTGITETSGITLSILADEIVLVSANNEENLFGSELIMGVIRDNTVNTTPKVNFVLSRVPYTDDPKDREKEFNKINEIKKDLKSDGFEIEDIHVIHSDRALEDEEELKIGDFENKGKISVENDYLYFFDKVIGPDLSKRDLEIFDKIVQAKKLLADAQQSKDTNQKLELLNQSVSLDSENEEAYLARAWVYEQTRALVKAERDYLDFYKYTFDKAYITYLRVILFYYNHNLYVKLFEFIEDNPIDTIISDNKAFRTNCEQLIVAAYDKTNQSAKALKYLHELIEREPDNPFYYFDLSEMYLRGKDFQKAEKYLENAIKLRPNFPLAIYNKALLLALKNDTDLYSYLDRAFEMDNKERHIIAAKLVSEQAFKKYYGEEAFQRILYKYNIRLKTEG